jgi:hypothetical protein
MGELSLAQLAVSALGEGEYAVLFRCEPGQLVSVERCAGDP